MRKRIIFGIVVLLAGLFFGCSKGDKPQATSASTGGVDDLSKHYTFSFAALDWGQIHGTEFNTDAIAQFIEKKFDFDWDVTVHTWTDWVEKPRIWINSMDMPDLVFTDFNYNDYKSYTEQELIKRLPDNWKEKYPTLAKLQVISTVAPALEERIPGTAAVIINPVFGHPPTSPQILGHGSFYFRKDWAKALGFEIKPAYTVKEMNEMVQAFMDRGASLPGVNRGRTDTLTISTTEAIGAYLTYDFPLATSFYKENGKYVWGPDSPRTLELLADARDAIEKGIVSRNFASYANREDDAMFFTGQSFAALQEGYIEFVQKDFGRFQDATGLDPFECIQVAILVGSDGYYTQVENLNYWSCMYFNPEMDDAKFLRLLDILEYIASDEGQDLVRLGIEGKDYTRNGDTVVITQPKDEKGEFVGLYNIYSSAGLYSHVTICADDFAQNNPAYGERQREVARGLYASKQKLGNDAGKTIPYDFDLLFFDGPNYRKFNVDVLSELARVCLMDGDLRTNYNNWLRDMRPVVDPVLGEINAAFGK
jgi:putative aldouronate transport system substrate-binding protein